MSKFTSEMVDKYARDLLIGLTPEENKNVLEEMEIIDKTCDMINEIEDIEKVEPMTHALDDFEVELRNDVKDESVDIEDLLKNADETSDREIELPKVVG